MHRHPTTPPKMHRSTTPRVHHQVLLTGNASMNQFKRPVIVYPDSESTLELGHPAHPSFQGLEVHRREAPDVGSEPGHLDTANYIVIYGGLSVIAKQIRATAVGDDGGAQRRLRIFCDAMLGRDKTSRGMNYNHPHQEQCDGMSNIASAAFSHGQVYNSGNVVDAALVSAEAGTDKGPAASKLEQNIGPRRHYQRLGIRDETPGADAGRLDGIQPNKDDSIVKQVVGPWKASPPPPPNAARQTRMNESKGVIHRLMPLGRAIHFDVDTDSFSRAGVPDNVTDYITRAARDVAGEYTAQNLGISFNYTPGPGPKVFSIRYDPGLVGDALAQAFFPSDPRERWQVRVSTTATLPWYLGGRLEHARAILAHEFAHILGLRHWNAGSDAGEMQEPSVLWPDTVDGDRRTIMDTGVHSSRLCFSGEDFRVIRELYSFANGAVVRDCRVIRDVDPYDGRTEL